MSFRLDGRVTYSRHPQTHGVGIALAPRRIRTVPEESRILRTIPIGTKVTVVNQPYSSDGADGTLYRRPNRSWKTIHAIGTKTAKRCCQAAEPESCKRRSRPREKEIDGQRVGEFWPTRRAPFSANIGLWTVI